MSGRKHRILSVLLALALLLSLGLSAFAEAELPEAPAEIPAPELTEPESQEPESQEPEIPEPETSEQGENGEEIKEEPELTGGIEVTAAALPLLSTETEPTDAEFYVSSDGSDAAGDGSREAPFATLSRAAEAACTAASARVYIILLSDLSCYKTARFYNKEIVLLSDEAPCRLVRAADFEVDYDAARGPYHPAMIECGRIENTPYSPASLTIGNVILDDNGAHGGTVFAEAVRTHGEQENRDKVQDGIVAAYDAGASIVLSDGTQLLNYGGLSAVYLDGGASLVMEDGSCIRDTLALALPVPGGSILLRGGAAAQIAEYATVVERTPPALPTEDETPDGEEAEIPEESEAAAETLAELPEETPEEPDGEPEAGMNTPGSEQPEEPAGTLPGEEPENEPETETENEPGEESENEPGEELEEESEEVPEEELDGELVFAAALPGETRGLTDLSLSDAATLSFVSDPESLNILEDSELSLNGFNYNLDYVLSFALSDAAKSLMSGLTGSVTADGTITLTLDSRLDVSLSGNPTLTSSAFELDGTPTLDNSVLTAPIKLRDNWNSESAATLTLHTTLPSLRFEGGKELSSSAAIHLTLHTARGDFPISPSAQTAETKMLGLPTTTLIYDENNNTGAQSTEMVPPQKDYPLDSSLAPTHDPDNVGEIVFIGWSETRDPAVYLGNETIPDGRLVTEVTIPDSSLLSQASKTVYAVYGYDLNGDGVADVLELTLSYDANGGEGAPEPESKLPTTLADGAKFDISATEPTREHYTFQGWAKEANATEAKYKHDAQNSADRDLIIHEDTTLYAVWKENPVYTLYYNANGGSNAPAAQSGHADDVDGSGRQILKLNISTQTPTRSGYSFLGWSATRSGSPTYQPNDEVQITGGNVMLYAIWQRSGSSGGSYAGGSGASSTGRSPSPKTGDTNNPLLYVLLLLASLAALAVVLVFVLGRRGKKRKNKTRR